MKNRIKVTLNKTEADETAVKCHRVLDCLVEALKDTAHEMLDKTGVVLIVETPDEKQE